jgi:hypothetical protein
LRATFVAKRRRSLNSIAAFFDPILPSSYGLILSERGEINICIVDEEVLSTKGCLTAKAGSVAAERRKTARANILATKGHHPRGIRHLLRETRYLKIGSMDLEGFVLSTLPVVVAAAYEASGEVAGVIDARSFHLTGPQSNHEWLPTSDAPASRLAVPATCGYYLRHSRRNARKAGFGLWGEPCHVVKQASDRADVLVEQGRFALVRGKVLSVVN